MEIYQWLFKKNGFSVSETGYFVYANGHRDRPAFDQKLEFDLTLIPYKGSTQWVEKSLADIAACLKKGSPPKAGPGCDYCAYTKAVQKII